MTDAELLTALKWNLKLTDDYLDEEAVAARDEQLLLYISSAKEAITREGADVSGNDGQLLIVLYAAWLYEHPNAEKMPRAIRWNLNNLIYDQHTRKQILIDKINALLTGTLESNQISFETLNKIIAVLEADGIRT